MGSIRFVLRYAATARMCVKEQSYFGAAELFSIYLSRLLGLAALLMIWTALFRQGADLEGLTLSQMLTYTLMATALNPMLDVRTPASNWLHDGTVLGLFQRPASIYGQLTAHTMGGWVFYLCCLTVPLLLLAALMGLPVAPASGWFYASICLSVGQGFAVDFLFTCLLMRLRNLEWTIHSIRSALNVLLTGALIPFAALPWGIGEWLALSPLGTLAGAPLALFTGLDSAARLIPAQLFWNATLWPLAVWLFARARERMVSYGG